MNDSDRGDWPAAIDVGVRMGVIAPEAARRALEELDRASWRMEVGRVATMTGLEPAVLQDLLDFVQVGGDRTPDVTAYRALLGAMLHAKVPSPATGGPPVAPPTAPLEWMGEIPRNLGPFDLLEPLAHHGRRAVFRARHRESGAPVAVKVLIASEPAKAGELERFQLEAAAIGRMGKHPNIVETLGSAVEGRIAYYAMEFVEGRSLGAALRERAMAPMEAAALLETIARVVHSLHANRIVHLDLKPDNVLIQPDGVPKLIDFGIALVDGWREGTVIEGRPMGTWSYMSPEQARREHDRFDARTDVYGLGGILYSMLTGFPPHPGESAAQMSRHILSGQIVAPSIARPGTSVELEAICLKCLQSDPARRYATAEALAEDLARFQRGERIHA